MSEIGYWQECVESAFEEAEITASQEQVRIVSNAVKSAHEMYGEMMGHHCIPNPLAEENDRLRKELEKEHAKVVCPRCGGRGRLITNYGTRSSDSECWECHGEGYK